MSERPAGQETHLPFDKMLDEAPGAMRVAAYLDGGLTDAARE